MQIPILQKNICLYFTISNVQTSSYEQTNTAQADYVGLNLCFWSHASPIILLTYYTFNFFKKCIVCTWLAPVFWRPRCSSCSSGWTCLLEVRKVCTVATIFSGTGTCKQMVNLCITHTHKNRASRLSHWGRHGQVQHKDALCLLWAFTDGQISRQCFKCLSVSQSPESKM